MSQASRRSFLRADKATIYGHGEAWIILLTRNAEPSLPLQKASECWTVKGGDDISVVYSSAHSAAQAINRVRPDLTWELRDVPPKSVKSTRNASGANLKVGAIAEDKLNTKIEANKISKDETFSKWLLETVATAQAAGILDQLPDSQTDIDEFMKKIENLRRDLKR